MSFPRDVECRVMETVTPGLPRMGLEKIYNFMPNLFVYAALVYLGNGQEVGQEARRVDLPLEESPVSP